MAYEPLTRPFYSEEYANYCSEKLNRKALYLGFKRFMDIILSLTGLIISLPLFIIFGTVIKIESKGSVIYKQERWGKDGKPFNIYKLRSMYADAEQDGPKWADKDDPRVTKVGKLIRNTRIDEIPQLINIIKGDMSIVGPRPERPNFIYEFNEKIPGFIYRLTVRPGLTGLAQVNGGYDISPEEKLEFDIEYIEKMRISLDIKIILKTALIVFTGYGAR